MASERYLAVVGLGEEDTARLRLLLRMVGGQLENRWRWGAEENADLVIVDPSELAGQIARNRAFSSGRRCAVFSASEPLRDGELRLSNPPKAEDLGAVLNGSSSSATPMASPLMQQKDDFYGLDALSSPDFDRRDEESPQTSSRQNERSPALGLDEFLKPDEAEKKPQFAVPIEINEDTLIEGTGGQSKRGERRVADSMEAFRKQGKPEPKNMTAPVKRGAPTTDPGKHWLRDYLRGNLLGGPATFTLDGVPALTLDPKERTFHSTAPLSVLAAYCKDMLPAARWKPLTTAELANLRSVQPGRAYTKLVWLDALVLAGGRLASHLDPGGRYRLKATPEIEHDFPNHARIAAAMREPAKLNEITAASGASMAEVFALVTAYDAIGLVEVERRLPRHDPAPAPSGLFARLRKPFGKN